MAPKRSTGSAREAPAPAPREGIEGLLVPLGVFAALALPHLYYSSLSPELLRDSKLLATAAGAALALTGLLVAALRQPPLRPSSRGSPLARTVVLLLAGTVGLAALSGLVNAHRVDPLTSAAVLAPLALAAAGASRSGEACAPRALGLLAAAGVFTGLLAALQRFPGIFRILEIPAVEPRFQAAALIGNPGDVAAALVFPALLLWMRLASAETLRGRLAAGSGLFLVLLGIGATEAIAPIVSFLAGWALHTLFDLRARWKPFASVLVLAAAAFGGTGAGRRALVKIDELARGQVAKATTQRDIGFLAAAEMIRAHPFLGVGPGAFENAFVPGRIRAEERTGRRLVHTSDAAHFENAHCDPLTLAAECGLPAALLAIGAAGALGTGLVRAARRERREGGGPPVGSEELAVLLSAFAVLSLASFPLRLAVVSGPFGYVAGLAFRRLDDRGAPAGQRSAAAPAVALLSLLLVGMTAAVALRTGAGWLQADGESRLRGAGLLQGGDRSELNDSARHQLRRALALRSRSATAWMALGSSYRLEHDWENAFLAYLKSLSLEERAETDFNLGLVASQGTPEARAQAIPFWRRSIWILPRLLWALPPAVDADAMKESIREAERRLREGGKPPDLPAGLAPAL
jgi:putative inorganic carbon (HCO3(-)) transporter